jgi:NAD(P)H-hydrate epimerase
MYLSQQLAKQIDQRLFTSFSLDQLMEIAGLSCFLAIQKEFRPSACLILVGPGNNGGDALVCSRYLQHFGYHPKIWYPKQNSSSLFKGLVHQLEDLNVTFIDTVQDEDLSSPFIVDGIFGFGFHGSIRSPFDTILERLRSSENIVSIDVPSGWKVDCETRQDGIQPKMLISLTGPKLCAKGFEGIHYVGGRFVPPALCTEMGFELVSYGDELISKISK